MSHFHTLYADICGWYHRIGFSADGDVLYTPTLDGPPELFTARAECTHKEVLDKEGHRVVSELLLLTDAPLKPLDLVDYDGVLRTVLEVLPVKDLLGKLDHYEAVL